MVTAEGAVGVKPSMKVSKYVRVCCSQSLTKAWRCEAWLEALHFYLQSLLSGKFQCTWKHKWLVLSTLHLKALY